MDNKDNKILPINDNVMIYSYTYHAYSQAILTNPMTQQELNKYGYDNWFYSNNIQLCYKNTEKKYYSLPADLYTGYLAKNYTNNPFLEVNTLSKRELLRMGDIIRYVIDKMDLGYYVELWLDEFYIPDTEAYKTYTFHHQTLLYGYDRKHQRFNIFHFEKNGYFEAAVITFEEFTKSFMSAYRVRNIHWIEDVIFMKPCKPDFIYQVNLELIIFYLEEYLQGNNTYRTLQYCYQEPENKYGKDIYNEIINLLKEDSEDFEDYRITNIILEHKKIMNMRMDYLYSVKCLNQEEYTKFKDRAVDLEKQARVIKALHLKYILGGNVAPKKIIEYITVLAEKEYEFYKMLLANLKEKTEVQMKKQGGCM